ncbi:GH24963 [Drosophila grimshawi]|uniref:GH24963 n=1 Tax=Drosophila grimshawi TaxID=7222 RepID=B4K2S7_DROGR|nr:GH24963 [Drosophila grimshawi]
MKYSLPLESLVFRKSQQLHQLGAISFYICRPLASVELLLLGRLLVGLAGGLVTACMNLYHSELAALQQRSKLSPFCPLGLVLGVVVAQICSLQSVLGSEQHWHIALAFFGIFVARKEAAARQLQLLRGYAADSEALRAELEDIENEANVQSTPSTFIQVLRNPKLRMPLIIVCAYLGGQQLSGINAIFYYSVSIFRRTGLTAQAAEWTNLSAGCTNLATALLGPILMEHFNRRPLMLFSTLFSCIFLFLFAILLQLILPFFISADLFEVAPRSAAMSVGSVVYWLCNLTIGMAFPS